MHIRIFNPWEIRKEKKELTFKSQESTNCQHRIGDDDIITSSTSDVATLRNVGINRLVARKRFMPRKQLLSYLVGTFGKLCKAYERLVSLIAVYLAIIISVLGELTEIIRYERKSTVGNSVEFFRSERWRNVSSLFLFYIFFKCLNVILSFSKELWLYEIICLIWKENKSSTKEKEELWSLGVRLVIAIAWLRNLQLGNVFGGTFDIRSGNIAETFLAGKCFKAYLRLLSDLWASCHINLHFYMVNLGFNDKFKRIYDRIYLYIYMICTVVCYPANGHHTLGLSQLKCILWFIFHQK